MDYITHIRLSDGTEVQRISHVRWEQPSRGRSGGSTRAQMVDDISEGNDVFVRARGNASDAKVVVGNATAPHLKIVADARETNNLLSLPQFKARRARIVRRCSSGSGDVRHVLPLSRFEALAS